MLYEREWEFPKGRRQLGEKDFQCAVREFSEESNIDPCDITLVDSTKHFEEVYLSINKIRYRNMFFLGRYVNNDDIYHFDKNNVNQAKEVRDVKWLSYEGVCEKLEHRNKEKYEMFKIVHEAVKKNARMNVV
jgi:8-oxo-dGTP pyrophosphatase MutT (NUDIX family)